MCGLTIGAERVYQARRIVSWFGLWMRGRERLWITGRVIQPHAVTCLGTSEQWFETIIGLCWGLKFALTLDHLLRSGKSAELTVRLALVHCVVDICEWIYVSKDCMPDVIVHMSQGKHYDIRRVPKEQQIYQFKAPDVSPVISCHTPVTRLSVEVWKSHHTLLQHMSSTEHVCRNSQAKCLTSICWVWPLVWSDPCFWRCGDSFGVSITHLYMWTEIPANSGIRPITLCAIMSDKNRRTVGSQNNPVHEELFLLELWFETPRKPAANIFESLRGGWKGT